MRNRNKHELRLRKLLLAEIDKVGLSEENDAMIEIDVEYPNGKQVIHLCLSDIKERIESYGRLDYLPIMRITRYASYYRKTKGSNESPKVFELVDVRENLLHYVSGIDRRAVHRFIIATLSKGINYKYIDINEEVLDV